MNPKQISRRSFLRAGLVGSAGVAALAALQPRAQAPAANPTPAPEDYGSITSGMDMGTTHPMTMPGTDGEVDHIANGFNPTDTLTDFDYGQVSTTPNGQILREF